MARARSYADSARELKFLRSRKPEDENYVLKLSVALTRLGRQLAKGLAEFGQHLLGMVKIKEIDGGEVMSLHDTNI